MGEESMAEIQFSMKVPKKMLEQGQMQMGAQPGMESVKGCGCGCVLVIIVKVDP